LLALGLSLAAGVSFVWSGVITAQAGPPGTGGGPTAEKILGSGSDTTQILMNHLDDIYMLSEGCAKFTNSVKPLDFSCVAPDPPGTINSENYEHDQMTDADFLGSSTGIKQLCTQGIAGTAYIDYARSSRGPKASDCTGLHFVAYARDGISLEANDSGATAGIHLMNNPDPTCTGLGFCLTQNQVKGIYATCTITNWNQVGGQNATIQIYTPQSGSGTRSQFETFLGIGDSTVCIPPPLVNSHQVSENQNSGIAAADLSSFIFPFSFAIYHTEIMDNGGYRLASIDGVAPNATTIGCLAGPPTCTIFPYSRYVYNVFCSTTAAGTCGAGVGHIVTAKANDYVNEEGWICKPSNTENPAWSGVGTPAVDNSAGQLSNLPHAVSLHFAGVNWQTLITNKIKSRGFAPLGIDIIGSGDLNSDHCRLATT
jgi:ABC-type phosphate transport system substrate-binding protein